MNLYQSNLFGVGLGGRGLGGHGLRAAEDAIVGSPADYLSSQLEKPYERLATGAILGAVVGTTVAATIGLAGQAIGPGNRAAMLGLLAIPVAGTILGVLWGGQR